MTNSNKYIIQLSVRQINKIWNKAQLSHNIPEIVIESAEYILDLLRDYNIFLDSEEISYNGHQGINFTWSIEPNRYSIEFDKDGDLTFTHNGFDYNVNVDNIEQFIIDIPRGMDN